MVLSPPIQMSLDDCLEYIADDELVEVNELCFRRRHVGTVKSFCKRSADELQHSFMLMFWLLVCRSHRRASASARTP